MEQEAVVARVAGKHVYLVVGGGGCGHCHETGGCQSGILGRLFRSEPRQFRMLNSIGAAPGDHVLVRVAEGATFRAALLTYFLPVLLLLLGAIAGNAIGEAGNGDVATALGALCGFAFGVLSALTLRNTGIGRIEDPVLVRRSSEFCITKETCR